MKIPLLPCLQAVVIFVMLEVAYRRQWKYGLLLDFTAGTGFFVLHVSLWLLGLLFGLTAGKTSDFPTNRCFPPLDLGLICVQTHQIPP